MRLAGLTTSARLALVLLCASVAACAAQRSVASRQEGSSVLSSEASRPAPSLQPAVAPVWKLGDEWSFQQESPPEKLTYVDVLSREETVDGIQCYVIASAGSEYYYRRTDIALYLRRDSSGGTVYRHVPPHAFLAWPMMVGKEWQETTNRERPQIPQSEEFRLVMRIEATETVTVPAGTFDTFKIVRRNNRTGLVDGEFWYSPDVRYLVRYRIGNTLRELTKFTRQP